MQRLRSYAYVINITVMIISHYFHHFLKTANHCIKFIYGTEPHTDRYKTYYLIFNYATCKLPHSDDLFINPVVGCHYFPLGLRLLSHGKALFAGQQTCDSEVPVSSPGWAPLRSGLRQTTYTCVPLSPSSIICYQPKG